MYINKTIALIKVADTMMSLLHSDNFTAQQLGIEYNELVDLIENRGVSVVFRFSEPYKQFGANHYSFMEYTVVDVQYSSDNYTTFTLKGSIDNLELEYIPWDNNFTLKERNFEPPVTVNCSAIEIGRKYTRADLVIEPNALMAFQDLDICGRSNKNFIVVIDADASKKTLYNVQYSGAVSPEKRTSVVKIAGGSTEYTATMEFTNGVLTSAVLQ